MIYWQMVYFVLLRFFPIKFDWFHFHKILGLDFWILFQEFGLVLSDTHREAVLGGVQQLCEFWNDSTILLQILITVKTQVAHQ